MLPPGSKALHKNQDVEATTSSATYAADNHKQQDEFSERTRVGSKKKTPMKPLSLSLGTDTSQYRKVPLTTNSRPDLNVEQITTSTDHSDADLESSDGESDASSFVALDDSHQREVDMSSAVKIGRNTGKVKFIEDMEVIPAANRADLHHAQGHFTSFYHKAKNFTASMTPNLARQAAEQIITRNSSYEGFVQVDQSEILDDLEHQNESNIKSKAYRDSIAAFYKTPDISQLMRSIASEDNPNTRRDLKKQLSDKKQEYICTFSFQSNILNELSSQYFEKQGRGSHKGSAIDDFKLMLGSINDVGQIAASVGKIMLNPLSSLLSEIISDSRSSDHDKSSIGTLRSKVRKASNKRKLERFKSLWEFEKDSHQIVGYFIKSYYKAMEPFYNDMSKTIKSDLDFIQDLLERITSDDCRYTFDVFMSVKAKSENVITQIIDRHLLICYPLHRKRFEFDFVGRAQELELLSVQAGEYGYKVRNSFINIVKSSQVSDEFSDRSASAERKGIRMILHGKPGVGKTHLQSEFRRLLGGHVTELEIHLDIDEEWKKLLDKERTSKDGNLDNLDLTSRANHETFARHIIDAVNSLVFRKQIELGYKNVVIWINEGGSIFLSDLLTTSNTARNEFDRKNTEKKALKGQHAEKKSIFSSENEKDKLVDFSEVSIFVTTNLEGRHLNCAKEANRWDIVNVKGFSADEIERVLGNEKDLILEELKAGYTDDIINLAYQLVDSIELIKLVRKSAVHYHVRDDKRQMIIVLRDALMNILQRLSVDHLEERKTNDEDILKLIKDDLYKQMKEYSSRFDILDVIIGDTDIPPPPDLHPEDLALII